jgi:fucose permease
MQLLLAMIYLSFISLGLPDSLLGAAWPVMYGELGVPLSGAGPIAVIIALGTIVSSLKSDALTRALGTGRLTALSVGLTAAALLGFSRSGQYWQLCLWAIPYGLGAGSVDAALNNYVALHYSGRHMSWLHCMWGVGASVGPGLMSLALGAGRGWGAGYRSVAGIQLGLALVLLCSLPLWKRGEQSAPAGRALSLRQVAAIPGAGSALLVFFCYCGVEQTVGLWAASYLRLTRGFPAQWAAGLAGLFFLGVTGGRALSGLLSARLGDERLTRLGFCVMALGVAALLLPGETAAGAALVLLGLGCAPVYPSMIHATPARFGAERSQAVIGVQMASAYVGILVMPPLFGLISRSLGAELLPLYLAAQLAVMAAAHRRLRRRAPAASC